MSRRSKRSGIDSSEVLQSGGTVLLPSLGSLPRLLSSIPPVRRFPGGFVNTETGEIHHFPWSTITPESPLERARPRPGVRVYPGGPRRVPVVPKLKAAQSRTVSRLDVCAKRRARREVLFALNRGGRHGAGVHYRRTILSSYGC